MPRIKLAFAIVALALSGPAAQLIGEPITPNLLIGLAAVFAGIWIATGEAKAA